ncbi:MAG: hypothetical protein OHK0022_27760 [Roseiflexaceae bacterium]
MTQQATRQVAQQATREAIDVGPRQAALGGLWELGDMILSITMAR